MSNRTFLIVFGLLAVVLAGSVGAGVWIINQSRQSTAEGSNLVGGPFQLTDHTGQQVTEADYAETYKIVYFGYTYCPDVCPTGLTVITEALDQLGPAAAEVKPLFITIDPERDTVPVMAEYQKHFHPSFSNLTGTVEQIAAVAKVYRVYYQKAAGEEGGAYLMDHSALAFLMAPGGGFLTHFTHEATPEQIVAAIQKLL